MTNTDVVELNHQHFKLAAPGTGIIACTAPKEKWKKLTSLKVLLSMRDASVGAGYGITGGGFVECGAIDKAPVGTIVDIAGDAFRENDEETKNFFTFITEGEFRDRVQGITNAGVRTADVNRVHACMFYALALTKKEWKKLRALPPGPERKGPFIEGELTWSKKIARANPEQYISLTDQYGNSVMDHFFHKHELRAFGLLAWHAAKGKLWTP